MQLSIRQVGNGAIRSYGAAILAKAGHKVPPMLIAAGMAAGPGSTPVPMIPP